MQIKMIVVSAILLGGLSACAESTPDKNSNVEAQQTVEKITPEQQAQIDAIDVPVLDEKNTDVPASVSESTPVDNSTP